MLLPVGSRSCSYRCHSYKCSTLLVGISASIRLHGLCQSLVSCRYGYETIHQPPVTDPLVCAARAVESRSRLTVSQFLRQWPLNMIKNYNFIISVPVEDGVVVAAMFFLLCE